MGVGQEGGEEPMIKMKDFTVTLKNIEGLGRSQRPHVGYTIGGFQV